MKEYDMRQKTDKLFNNIQRQLWFMKFKLKLLLCWLGIHRYKIIDANFVFASQRPNKTIQCKICGIKKMTK